MLDNLQKYKLFTNLEKYQFYKKEILFLDYIILAQKFKIEYKQIKILKN